MTRKKATDIYAYSFDRKKWYGDYMSREEALDAAISVVQSKEELGVYTGIGIIYKPTIDTKDVLELVGLQAELDTGLDLHEWFNNVTPEELAMLGNELEKTLNNWLEKTGQKPAFYKEVVSVQVHGKDDYFKQQK